MTTLSEIKYSRLENRFDSEYYKPECLDIEKNLSKLKNVELLGNIVHSFTNGVEIREFVKEGVPYIRVSDTNKEFMVDLSEVAFVRELDAENIKKKIELKSEDILTNRSGTLGISQIVTSDIKNCIISSHIIRLAEISSEINPYFLVTFLNCKYGRLQILRNNNGGVVPEINQPSLKSILIPIPSKPFQEKIEKIVKEAFSKRKLADQKYNQAKQLLEKELGIDKLRLKEEKTFEANFSNLEQSLRFDSEYYKPKYKQITKFLKNSGFEVRKLKEVVKISDKKIDPTKEPTKKFRYVPIAKINSNGEIGEWDEFSGWQAPSRARMLIKKGDVLVSSLGGSIDKIALVPEELNNSLATTGTFVINSENYYSEFLFLLFRTELIRLQLEQKTAGAIMTAVPKTTFGDLLIPLIPKSNQEQISTLVRESFSLRKESKNLLEDSKEIVETAIENGT